MSTIRVNTIQDATGNDAISIDSSGNVTLAQNLAATTMSGDLTLGANGVYLGGTGAANYLDDYEEGTWTPTLVNFTETGTSTATGRYTKIGRIVYFNLQVSTTGTIAATINSSRITGLPFTVAYRASAAQSGSNSWAAAFKGICLVYLDEAVYPETFSAQDDLILITGFYETT